jgi:hypothetical protein
MSNRSRLAEELSQGEKRVVIRELVFPPIARGEGGEPEPSDLQVTHEPDQITYELAPDLTLTDAFALGLREGQHEHPAVSGIPHFILPVAEITRE